VLLRETRSANAWPWLRNDSLRALRGDALQQLGRRLVVRVLLNEFAGERMPQDRPVMSRSLLRIEL
jgi:hypothetical protein